MGALAGRRSFLSFILAVLSGSILKVRRRSLCLEVFLPTNCRRDEQLTGQHRSDRWQKIGSQPFLDDISESADLDGCPNEIGIFVHCEKDQAGLVVRTPKSACRFDAIKLWHRNIENDNI